MASVAYLDLAGFRALTLMPSVTVTEIENETPGWIDAQLLHVSSWMDSRLIKRYAAPFVLPYPLAVQRWLANLVTVRAFAKRGLDPLDAQFPLYKDDADVAAAEIKEAADSETGLFELPLRANTDESGVTKQTPRGYSEQSPYVSYDRQARVARQEDQNGNGSGG